MIRLATAADIPAVSAIYDKIHAKEARGDGTTGWLPGVYPTERTAREALGRQELFVLERDGAVLAAAKINQEQVAEYDLCPWSAKAPAEEVMVLHTLVVDPEAAGGGLGRAFVAFYENYALEHGCRYLRMDTNEKNLPARQLYKKLGYREAGIVPCDFNGIPGVQLVCLEKTMGDSK